MLCHRNGILKAVTVFWLFRGNIRFHKIMQRMTPTNPRDQNIQRMKMNKKLFILWIWFVPSGISCVHNQSEQYTSCTSAIKVLFEKGTKNEKKAILRALLNLNISFSSPFFFLPCAHCEYKWLLLACFFICWFPLISHAIR